MYWLYCHNSTTKALSENKFVIKDEIAFKHTSSTLYSHQAFKLQNYFCIIKSVEWAPITLTSWSEVLLMKFIVATVPQMESKGLLTIYMF